MVNPVKKAGPEVTVTIDGQAVFTFAVDGPAPVVIDSDSITLAWVQATLRAAAEYLSAYMARPITIRFQPDP